MPIVCIDRPVRFTPRPWKPRAVGRVARYAHKEMGGSEVDAIIILAFVAVNVGLGGVICRAAGVMVSVSTIVEALKKISLIIAIEGSVALIIKALTRFLGRLAKAPKAALLLAVVVAVLLALQKVLDALKLLLVRVGFLEELAGLVQLTCTWVHRVSAEIGGNAPTQFEVIKWHELLSKSDV